jgi:hypothetical protein
MKQETDSLTIQTMGLRIADRFASSLGLLERPILMEDLIGLARTRAGLTDFGDVDFAEPLRVLLASCGTEAALGIVGRMATRWDVVRFLTNLLRMQAAERSSPAICTGRITRPIFITGLPRSGTTFLHRLMLEDAGNRAPLVWETIYPFPDTAKVPGHGIGRDPRITRVARQLKVFEGLAPEFRALHPLEATSPQECSEITAHVFRSLRFDTNYHIPSYRSWMDADVGRHLPAYRFHKRFLQHLQHQYPPERGALRWVLKCPEHLFALRAIRSVYPDACMVFVHRDPVKVLLSQAKLTEVLRRPFTRRMDARSIGRDESARWLDGAHRMMEVGDDAGLPDPVCHVHHIDLIADPVSTVESVYRHFGLCLTPDAAAAMEQSVAKAPNGGYGRHDYRSEDHGLDTEAERARFRPYMLRFGITPETMEPRPARSPAAPTPAPAARSVPS